MDKKLFIGSFFPRLRLLRHLSEMRDLKQFVAKNACPRLPSREAMYDQVSEKLRDIPILYLEFGVWQGKSMEYWAKLNTHRQSRLIGFDTFEGLPEGWEHALSTTPKGTFSTEGRTPATNDSRVQYVRGLFQDTLTEALTPLDLGAKPVVAHLDADLYSSTLYVLAKLDRILDCQESYLCIFDEFASVQHEFRAFHDYLAAFRRGFEPIAHTAESFDQFCVRLKQHS